MYKNFVKSKTVVSLQTRIKNLKFLDMAKKKRLTRAEKEAQPMSEDLKRRIIEVKERLPKTGLVSLYFHYFIDESFTDSVKNKSRVQNVLYCRVSDEKITENFEKLAELLTSK